MGRIKKFGKRKKFHKSSTDADPQHGLCPIEGDSWYKYDRAAAHGNPCPEHTYSLPKAVMDAIKPTLLMDLSASNLLRRCLHGRTQNCNDSLNNVIWSTLPKTTFVNSKTLKLGALDAVLTFNEGVLARVKVLEDMCAKASANCVVGLKKQDARRVYTAEKAFEEIEKRARKAKSNTRRRLEEEQEEEDDPAYGAGLF